MYKQVHYLLNLLNNCTLDFVRLLLCYRVEKEPEGRLELSLVLDFKMNIIKWKLHWSEIKRVITKSHDREAGVYLHSTK